MKLERYDGVEKYIKKAGQETKCEMKIVRMIPLISLVSRKCAFSHGSIYVSPMY
jgi:hypothetical protein